MVSPFPRLSWGGLTSSSLSLGPFHVIFFRSLGLRVRKRPSYSCAASWPRAISGNWDVRERRLSGRGIDPRSTTRSEPRQRASSTSLIAQLALQSQSFFVERGCAFFVAQFVRRVSQVSQRVGAARLVFKLLVEN